MNDFLNVTRHSIAWFKKAHDAGQLVMRPPYQRNPVWTDAQKSYLIDTILRGYPIPELYLQEAVDAEGQEVHTVVDGQQRLRACLEFIENRYELTATETQDWPEARFDDLAPDERKLIFGYNFIVRQLPNVPEEELRTIFKRINRNTVTLNRQELRHATYWGPFIQSMETLAELDTWTIFRVFTANDVRRMLDVEYMSELAVGILHGVQNKKLSLEKWYEIYESDFPDRTHIEASFRTVCGELQHVLPMLGNTRWRKKSDFYTLFLTFAAYTAQLPLSREGRRVLGEVLTQFGSAVDRYLATGIGGDEQVRKYAHAVERAASDVGNRRARAEALLKATAKHWKAEA